MMYGALEWCTQNYTKFVDELRELMGGGVFQMPANISVLRNADLAREFQTFWQTPQNDAVTRMKLFKLAWDMVGSEFAGRHLQYEKFYAGASFIVRNHSFRETDWAGFNKLVDDLMAGYDHGGALGTLAGVTLSLRGAIATKQSRTTSTLCTPPLDCFALLAMTKAGGGSGTVQAGRQGPPPTAFCQLFSAGFEPSAKVARPTDNCWLDPPSPRHPYRVSA